ncbi:MAG: TonB-dependent receptor [Rhodospirillaceae bacterium]|nr:TonB-dependent receptor [Rhodospirillaceae bacterium]
MMTIGSKHFLSHVSLMAVCVGLTATASAQQGQTAAAPVLEEIVVTAQSRTQSLQDVPIAVSAVSADSLQQKGLQKVEDLQVLVPNFTMTETGIGTNMFIRGIGSGINQGFEQSVAMFIDGVHYGRAQQARAPFLDLERVEVLRGPQSILFGKNAVAGALSLTTAKPTREFEGWVDGSYEFEDSEYTVGSVLSGPFSDTVRGRVAVRYRDFNGNVRNLTLNRKEPQREDWTVRGTLEADVTDNLVATLKLETGSFDVVGRHTESFLNQSPAAAGPFRGLTWSTLLRNVFGAEPGVLNAVQDNQRSSNGDFSNNDSDTGLLTLVWDIGGYELKSTTAHTKFKYAELCDCDFTGAFLFDATLNEKYKQTSQEFRLTSPIGETFDFIAGAFYQTSDHDYGDSIRVPGNSTLIPAVNAQSPGAGTLIGNTEANRVAVVENDLYAVFAQGTFNFDEAWSIQAGGRYTHEEKDGTRTLSIFGGGGGPLPAAQIGAPLVYGNLFGITSTNLAALGPGGAALLARLGSHPVAGSRTEKKFSPDVKLVWRGADDVMLYANWARGFKSGGFDFRSNNRFFYATLDQSFQFEDERATNIELGGKFGLADGRATLNLAIYQEKFKDLQISIFDGRLGFNVGNAATAEIKGLEADLRWLATEALSLNASLAYTDFEFEDFRNGQCYFGQTPNVILNGVGLCDYTGKSNQLTAKVRGNVGAEYTYALSQDLNLRINLDGYYSGKYDAAPTFDPLLVQKAYALIDLGVAVSDADEDWQVSLVGQNLTDKQYLQYGQDMPLAGSTFGMKAHYAFYDQGRTIRLQSRINF